MPTKLIDLIPREPHPGADILLGRFLTYVEQRSLRLYPAQESAILELYGDKNVILNTPTGSGKSLVAMAGHFKAIAERRRSVYTCPIKALVNEKWLALCREFGPENVGLCTGDATVNRDARILCCTAEILANIALRQGEQANVHEVVMDEFHYYADRDRGYAWQAPLLTLPQARFLLMSATLGDTSFFEKELTRLNGRPTVSVNSVDRPVALSYAYTDTPLSITVETLIAEKKAPVYVVHFTQLEAAQNAQSFTSAAICTREEKEAIADALVGCRFNSPHGPDIKRWLRQGIGIHHAGLLPKYRILVERLAQHGLLKVICGTDTLGVGINIPIRTVLFTRLCKYDGEKTGILSARDFHQISGRAGRKGFDDCGWVIAQAPEYAVKNIQLDKKQARFGKKVVKRRPPDKNFVNWDKETFFRLVAAPPERLVSRFRVTHGMLLNVLSRNADGCNAMRALIAQCHESARSKQALRDRAWQLFRSLVERKIIEFIPPTPSGAKLRVNVELQDDFSLDQTLSLYLLDALKMLDVQSPEYALDVLTLAESILEDPDVILRKQLDKIKARAMAEMKANGVPFEERVEKLETLEYPKPNREFIYATFNEFIDQHPWVGQENIRPKSIVREMVETYSSFSDYVREYGLQRAEGLLLRHLNDVYKVLAHTVPDTAKTEALWEIEEFLGAMIRQIDSSLLDEWNRLCDPAHSATEIADVRPPGAEDITRDVKGFMALIRTRIFAFLRDVGHYRYGAALGVLQAPFPEDNDARREDPSLSFVAWTCDLLRDAFDSYRASHGDFRLDPEARNARHTCVTASEDQRSWRVEQTLVDAEEHNDWVVEFDVDIPRSREAGEPVMRLRRVGSREF